MKKSQSKSQGIAIITVLIIISILTAIIVTTTQYYQNIFNKIKTEETFSRNITYAMFGEDISRQALQQDKNDYDYYGADETWTQKIDSVPIDGIILSGEIIDLDGKFNINNLDPLISDKTFHELTKKAFVNLLKQFDLDKFDADSITNAVVDWLDKDTKASYPGGAEDPTYESSNVPYLSSNTTMTHISELKLVKGITPQIYEQISPCLTALPIKTKINVNTASNEVIEAYYPGKFPSTSTLKKCEVSKYKNFANISGFLNGVKVSNANLTIDVKSSYFVAKITAEKLMEKTFLKTYFVRNDGKAKVIFRNFADSIIPSIPKLKEDEL